MWLETRFWKAAVYEDLGAEKEEMEWVEDSLQLLTSVNPDSKRPFTYLVRCDIVGGEMRLPNLTSFS